MNGRLLLGTEGFVDEATACFRVVSSPLAPAHWEADLTNVIWMAVRTKVLTASEGAERLGLALLEAESRKTAIEAACTHLKLTVGQVTPVPGLSEGTAQATVDVGVRGGGPQTLLMF